jgi:hypothetical protein
VPASGRVRPSRSVGRAGGEPDRLEIRSYHSVFALERRLYRIDGLPLNPAGVPLRGVAYFAVLLGLALTLRELPVAGPLVGLVPWYLRDLLAPGLCAFVLGAVGVDGRPFHIAAPALLRYRLSPRCMTGLHEAYVPGRSWRARERDRAVLLPRSHCAARSAQCRLLVVHAARRLPERGKGQSIGARGARR